MQSLLCRTGGNVRSMWFSSVVLVCSELICRHHPLRTRDLPCTTAESILLERQLFFPQVRRTQTSKLEPRPAGKDERRKATAAEACELSAGGETMAWAMGYLALELDAPANVGVSSIVLFWYWIWFWLSNWNCFGIGFWFGFGINFSDLHKYCFFLSFRLDGFWMCYFGLWFWLQTLLKSGGQIPPRRGAHCSFQKERQADV